MADALRIAASLAVINATVASVRSLCDTVDSIVKQSKTLRTLQVELQSLTTVLGSLMQVAGNDISSLILLEIPMNRCGTTCWEFEQSMKEFIKRHENRWIDWTKLEFMRGDINDFINTVGNYRSTILIGLGSISLRTSIPSLEVLQEYKEMIKDTTHKLELHLQRIDAEQVSVNVSDQKLASTSVESQGESAVTLQGLRICQDAGSCIESSASRESTYFNAIQQPEPGRSIQEDIEAPMLARQAFNSSRASISELFKSTGERLQSAHERVSAVENEVERSRFLEEIDMTQQCLTICQFAWDQSQWKARDGEKAVTEADGDQILVDTLADFFDVKNALARTHSTQIGGSLTQEHLDHVINKRHDSLSDKQLSSLVIQLRGWAKMQEYLVSQYEDVRTIGDIIVLVSDNGEDTWCTNCEAYTNWRWGSTGSNVLTFVDSLLPSVKEKHSFDFSQELPHSGVKSWSSLDDNIPSIHVHGPQQLIHDIADVFGWLFDSLRYLEDRDGARYRTASVVVLSHNNIVYETFENSMRSQPRSEAYCWVPLLPNKAISKGRIPERSPVMRGLEIEYSLLISISGVDIPTIEDGGIYLDGPRSALFPIRKDSSWESLQWHFRAGETSGDNDQTEKEDDVFSYSECPPAMWYRTRVLEELQAPKRHFVGWCRSAIITFGTSLQSNKQLDWSGAKTHRRCVVETTTMLNLNLSFHGIGATAGRSFKKGTTERNPYENHEANFRTALISASKSQVLLFRSSTKQAWLVPKSSFLLQLVQSFMKQLMREDPSLSLPLCLAEASCDGGYSAYQALWYSRNECLPLGTDSSPCYLFNVVRTFLHALQKLAMSSEPGNVRGWEMKDVIDPPEFFDMKQQGFRWIQLPMFGGWNQLLPEMRLIFFFEGLADPIIAERLEYCAACSEIPKYRNLLGATLVSLKHFTRRYRSKYLDGSGQLTESCYWDSPSLLFEERCNGREHCGGVTQKIVRHCRGKPPTVEQLALGENGAVIFEPCGLSHEETPFISKET